MLSHTRVTAFVMLMAIASVACREKSDGGDGAAQNKAPSDDVAQNGYPTLWIEAPASGGAVREYFEGVLRSEGPGGKEDRGLLTVMQDGPSATRPYELTEYRFEDYGLPMRGLVGKLLGAGARSAGRLTTADAGVGVSGPQVAYRLDGGASPAQALVFLRSADTLVAAVESARLGRLVEDVDSKSSLHFAGSAAKGRVEVGDSVDRYLYWGIRLRVGDELVARLVLYQDGAAWSLKTGTNGKQLQQQGTRTDESDRGRNFQVFTFRAVAPGTTDLEFDYRLPSNESSDSHKTRVEVH